MNELYARLILLTISSLFFNLHSYGQLTTKEGFVEIDDVSLFYEIKGEGEVIVLLHDGLINSQVWNYQFNSFSKHFKVLRYDRRGYGKSGISMKPYSDFDDLYILLEKLNIDKANFVGISGGAGIVIDFALKYPESVDKIALIGGVINGFEYSKQFVNRNLTNMLPFIQNKDIETTMENWKKDKFLVPNSIIENPSQIDSLFKSCGKYLPNIFEIISLRKELLPEAIYRLDEINSPTLVLVGDKDNEDVKKNADILQTSIRNVIKVVAEDAGHLINLEQPDEFNSIVLEFIKE